MFQSWNHRFIHFALLLAVGSLLFLPNLGAPSLWDIDEGNNAEAAREMLEASNWIVPTFNFELRVDKPALLYWLQISAYRVFGVNEFAARLPSALAAFLALFLTYELGRRMFGASAGLLAGIMLGSTIAFCGAAHFANPDALLCTCMLLTFLFFWSSMARGDRSWFLLCGICSGLAMLAKGPIGLLLPSAVTLLFLLWSRRVQCLLDWRLLAGMLTFGVVMIPWYAWVGAETRGVFLKGFFLTHNLDRFTNSMEGHTGTAGYYLLVLLIGFAPWSAFLGLALWYSFRFPSLTAPADPQQSPARQAAGERDAVAFLWCWLVVYLAFFSVSRTKLPNYILPIYPAVALLTGRFLDRWRCGIYQPHGWLLQAGPCCLLLVGGATIAGLLLAGGAWSASFVHGRQFPGVEKLAALGSIPILGGLVTGICLWRRRRTPAVTVFAATNTLFLALVAALGPVSLEGYKAPRELVRTFHDDLIEHDVRVGAFEYFQPSLVFYCQREVHKLGNEQEMLQFLDYPLKVYLILPAARWEQLQSRVPPSCHLLGRRHDLYRHCDVVLVTNR
jgi:4-amino-4-deoxy-L-arabinose transferase-like glycosyltransferase